MTSPLATLLRVALLAAALLPVAARAPVVAAQDGGPGTGGLVAAAQARTALARWERVLVIGAHPDDEDTDLITILSRGHGIRTAYLSLTRGEGGQNLIGGELGAALGVLRSEELLAARRVDGGHQFFTRAYDFGFSKSAEETIARWGREAILEDIVRVIRRFRPHVIVSVWSGTARDGHGHHVASGILAREAFRAAGDPARFPRLSRDEGLRPWQPTKFYVSGRFDPTAAGLALDGGVLDAATGHSLHQLAMRSRSQHRSQDMGRLEEPGPARTRVVLVERADGTTGPDTALFQGVSPEEPASPLLAGAVRLAEHGVVLDAYVGDAEVVRGQAVPVTAVIWNAGTDTIGATIAWMPRDGWTSDSATACATPVQLAPGALHRCVLPMRIAPDAFPDQPYFLREAVEGARYVYVGRRDDFGEPFEPPVALQFRIALPDGGPAAVAMREVTARRLDQAIGELREPVAIVPRVLLDVVPGRLLWPRGQRTRPFRVAVEHAGPDSTVAAIRLVAPDGWQVSPAQEVRFARPGERQVLTFQVTAPADVPDGEAHFLAEAAIGADTMRLGARRVRYSHVRERILFQLAEAVAVVAPVELPVGRRIGYVRGAADAIPEALGAAGLPVTLLDLAQLGPRTLDSLDVVVIGPRAYETDPALARAHPRLLAWVEAGGTLITQYQQYQYVQGGFPPYPFTIARPHDRITDETAPVAALQPGHPVLRAPNVIGPDDWTGWIQERGLYFARDPDPAWQPLLRIADPGESPTNGALLVAERGRGTVVYTGLAFFRQLPAAVPGAWKLFANLLAQ